MVHVFVAIYWDFGNYKYNEAFKWAKSCTITIIMEKLETKMFLDCLYLL